MKTLLKIAALATLFASCTNHYKPYDAGVDMIKAKLATERTIDSLNTHLSEDFGTMIGK